MNIRVVFCDDTQSVLDLAEKAVPVMWQTMWSDLQEKCGVPRDGIPNINILPVLMNGKGSGEQVVRTIVDRRPDVILTDLRMPGINGLDLARLLHRNEETRAIPIIAVSAFADERSIARQLLKEGLIVDIHAKPFNYTPFLASVLECAGYESLALFVKTLTTA